MDETKLFHLYWRISNTKVLRWLNKVNNLAFLSNLSFSRKKGQFLQQHIIFIPLHPHKKQLTLLHMFSRFDQFDRFDQFNVWQHHQFKWLFVKWLLILIVFMSGKVNDLCIKSLDDQQHFHNWRKLGIFNLAKKEKSVSF